MNETGPVDVLLFDMRVVHNTVEGAEQEDGDETRVFDRPRVGVRAGLQQIAKKIDGDIFDQSFARRRAGAVEEHVVQPNGIEIAGGAGRGPFRKFPLPVVSRLLGDRGLYLRQALLPVAIAECGKHIVLGGKIEIEGAFGYIGVGCDLLDGGGCDAFSKKQLLSSVHQLIASFSWWLRSGARFAFGGHGVERASATERWSVTVG
jgi:hypothetical protein